MRAKEKVFAHHLIANLVTRCVVYLRDWEFWKTPRLNFGPIPIRVPSPDIPGEKVGTEPG